jgi:hypothetical protein
MLLALILIVVSAAWRVAGVHVPEMSNFTPLMALTFCGAVYFRDRRLWLVPFAALLLSDLYIDRWYAMHYGYEWRTSGVVIRLLCFAAALGIGRLVATRRSWANLLSGALGGSLLFYFVTNTATWAGDSFYAGTAAGWWQAMTVGHPEFPPTLLFFRNTFVSDMLFTTAFAGVMELSARRAGQPSLLGKSVA